MANISEFNTTIYSSKNEGVYIYYALDEVITSNFEGPYTYTLTGEYPQGTSIEQNKITDVSYILIPSNVEFLLEVFVSNGELDATASTNVITATKNTFLEEKQSFLSNENVSNGIDTTKNGWSFIVGTAQP